MRITPRRELQDHSGPKSFRHVLSPQTPQLHGGASWRSANGPLYAYGYTSHPGLPFGLSGDGAPHSSSSHPTGYSNGCPSWIATRSLLMSARSFCAAHTWMSLSVFIRSSFSVGPSRKAADLGASEFVGGAGRTQQKGELISTQHAVSFPSRQLVLQPVFRSHLSMKALMESLALPLLGRLNAPSVVPTSLVLRCKTFREAVRMAWAYRRVHYMTLRQLAIDGGFYPQHVGDWLNPDDKPTRRSLPAECIARFEVVVGNTLCSQWLAHRSALTVLETMQADRALA